MKNTPEILKFRGLVRYCEKCISKNERLESTIWIKISNFIKEKCSQFLSEKKINQIEADRIYMIISQLEIPVKS